MATPGIKPILRNTMWCINAPDNMIALPVWGATVKHYCMIRQAGSFFKAINQAPEFANLPQHNWDHNIVFGYTDEVTAKLIGMGEDIIDREHNGKVQDIARALNRLSEHFNGELEYRGGVRKGGTDAAWQTAITSDGSVGTQWYLPFSMAEEGFAKERPFPLKRNSPTVSAWIDRIAGLLSGK